jgi:two-component system phosphate regulon sensor histidine kinase PhoR
LVAMALHHENRDMGALWIAYAQPRNFTDEEIRFLGTLAGQAAVAVSNALLYASAEIGRQRLEAVLVSTPEPVLVFDEQARLLLVNAAALQVPGLVISAAPGRPINETVSPKELIGLIIQPQEEKRSSCKVNLANGRVYYASVSAVNAEGRPVGKVCVLQDITHFTELDKLKSDFVATVSHDLRSPLTLMRGYVTMLQMVGELNEQQKNYTRKIISGVENMTRLVNNLLDLGRIDAGIGLQIERILAQEVVEQVIGSLQPQATQKNIQLTHEGLDQPPVFLEVDRALMQQAVYNLIENAIKYTPTGGQVRVKLQPQGNEVVFEVHDTGIGIAPLDLPRLFERFYRSTRREAYAQRGTSLGLAIVKSIAERHEGRVWVESQLGKGSIFFLEVPLLVKKVENSKGELTNLGRDML